MNIQKRGFIPLKVVYVYESSITRKLLLFYLREGEAGLYHSDLQVIYRYIVGIVINHVHAATGKFKRSS